MEQTADTIPDIYGPNFRMTSFPLSFDYIIENQTDIVFLSTDGRSRIYKKIVPTKLKSFLAGIMVGGITAGTFLLLASLRRQS